MNTHWWSHYKKYQTYSRIFIFTNVVPKLYEEALDHSEKQNSTILKKKASKKKALQSPRVTRTTKKAGISFPCKSCVFTAKHVSLLNDHMNSVHKRKAVANKGKQPKVTPYKPPTLSAAQFVEITSEMVKSIQCYDCRKGFDNYEDLSQHEKEQHELSCTFCEDIFFTKMNLKIMW